VAFWLAALLTLFLFPLMPAKGPLAFLWQGSIPYMPTSALYQGEIIPELRDRIFTAIDLGALRGLVCAPSAHSACAVLYLVSAWRLRPLRWILIPVNIAMLLSIPVEGTHYLTDMLMGAMVALTAIMLVRYGSRILAGPPLKHAALASSVQSA
jgi:membrane-associated phospholipid phosphatase